MVCEGTVPHGYSDKEAGVDQSLPIVLYGLVSASQTLYPEGSKTSPNSAVSWDLVS